MSYSLNELKKLAATPDEYKKAIQNCTKWAFKVVKNVSKTMPKELFADNEFIEFYSARVLASCKSWVNYKSIGLGTAKYINSAYDIVNSDTKQEIVKIAKKLIPISYTYVKRELLSIICKSVSSEGEAKIIISCYCSLLSCEQISKLLVLIPHPESDKNLQQHLKKSAFVSVMYSDVNSTNDKDKRLQFIKSLIDKPSLLKHINDPIIITLDELKALPPGKRFNLLSSMFEVVFNQMRWWGESYYYKNHPEHRLNELSKAVFQSKWLMKVRLDTIPDDDLKTMLFSKALNDNERITKWYDNYNKFINFKKETKKELEQLYNVLK